MCVNLNLTFKMQRKRVPSANHVHSTIPAAHDFWKIADQLCHLTAVIATPCVGIKTSDAVDVYPA